MSAVSAPRLRPFPLGDVRIGDDGMFARSRRQMLHLARAYPVDRLLAVFRANAGLDVRGAEPPGAWEGFGHPDEQPWSEHDYPGREAAHTANLLRGHYAGHFLSMLSLAAAGEADAGLRGKVDEFVAGLAEVQAALAASGRYSHRGFLAAYGEWQFSRLEQYAPYGEIWAPYYTCHKIMAGLLDAYELAGSTQALEIVTGMARWVGSRLSRLDAAQLQRMWSLYIAGEFGGMNETLARLAAVTGEPEFLDTARLFDQRELIDAGRSGLDILDGMHANQHLPQLIGYVDEYEATGDREYLDAAQGVWGQVVPGRMYPHGGTGESELWGPAGSVARDIGRRNAETCATYNLVKLSRRLFAHTLDPRYTDYIDRALSNHILGSRRDVDSDVSPEVTYMFPVHPGALPEYDNIGTCCGGTGLENHVTQQASMFLRGEDGDLWLTQYTPAELDWTERGVRVVLEQEHPFTSTVRVRVEPTDDPLALTVHLRIPDWVEGEPRATVAGRPLALDVRNGYASVRRTWRRGEALTLELPTALRAVPAVDDPHLVHLRYGPHVLVARSDSTTALELAIAAARRPDGSLVSDADPAQALRDGGVTVDGIRFVPSWTGADARYHMYVRVADAVVGFAGVQTEVPARQREDGSTLLDDVWAGPGPVTVTEFAERVVTAVRDGLRDGLLGGAEAHTVLHAACAAVIAFGDGDGSAVAALDAARDSIRVDEPAAPAVEIRTAEPAAASGWHLQAPTILLRAATWDGAQARIDVRIGDGPWQRYDGPLRVDVEGEVVVQARAIAGGRTGTATRVLHIDTRPPVTQARVTDLGASVEILLVAEDEVSGVEQIHWQGEGTFWATFQEAFVRTLTDREQVIEFAASDRAGNEEPLRRLVLPARSIVERG